MTDEIKPEEKGSTDRELIMQTYFQTSNEAAYWNKMANDQVHEISKQLLGAAVIAIPLAGTLVVGIRNLNLIATVILGIILGFGLLAILGSIIAGIKNMEEASKFFNNYAMHNANRAKALFSSRNLKLDNALVAADIANLSSSLSAQSSDAYSKAQGWLVGGGLFLISVVTIALIFMPR